MTNKPEVIRLHGYLEENLQDYKKASMFLAFPKCSFKCATEQGLNPEKICQNYFNIKEQIKEYRLSELYEVYRSNPITEAFVLGGLEPLDSFDDVWSFISFIRDNALLEDDIVIYTGYYPEEIQDKINKLKKFKNIYLKCGRFRIGQKSHYDEVLGVNLANEEQFGMKIS